jgi:NADPH:quinone reductase-like Zn-dependent oxidoreductase
MGTATLQLAKLAGASVVATTRDAAKSDQLGRYGADLVVDTGRPNALAAIKDFSRGEGVDGAVEYTGAPELMRLCIDAMRMGGTFCPVGGELTAVPLRVVDLVSRELNVHGVRASTRNDQRIVVELLEKGRIRMPIHAVLPLSQAAEAHRMLESGDVVGRIILHPWE